MSSSATSAKAICWQNAPHNFCPVAGPRDFRTLSTDSIVLQLRVVAGTPNTLSIWPRQPIVFMCRRYTPYTKRFFAPMICTSHSPASGRATGRETRRRDASERMLTNGTTSPPGGSVPKGFPLTKSNQIVTTAARDRRVKRHLLTQDRQELCAQPWFENDKRAGRPHVHGVVRAQLFCKNARAKTPVPAHVHTPKENNQSHAAHH